jgi:hypothetical protein
MTFREAVRSRLVSRVNHLLEHKGERLWMQLAWVVPKRLAYWCAVRVGVNATQGKYSDQEVPALMFMQALERWED